MNNTPNFWVDDEVSESISKPTREEYEKAKEEMNTFAKWVCLARNKQTELIDALAIERENEKMYRKLYEKNKEVVSRFEIYEKIEQAATGKK